MTGTWKIIMPIAASNLVLNPSAEIATPANYSTFNSGSVVRVTTQARFGDYSYSVSSAANNSGMYVQTQAMANAVHYVTYYVYGTPSGTMRVSADGATFINSAIIGGASGGWARYSASISASQCNGSSALRIVSSTAETFLVDAVQVEQSAYYTTYIDGNRGESPIYGENTGNLYFWNGHRHASTSWRDAQERGGGRELDLLDSYGVSVQQVPGAGMPPLTHNLQGLALQPGAAFQSTKTLPREVVLVAETHSNSIANLHSKRKALIDLVKPDGVRGAQSFILGYSGANSAKTVYCRFRYVDGLGIGRISGGTNYLENQIPIQLEAVSPYWFEDNRETASLGFTTSLTSVNRVMARVNGLWQKLGTGFSGTCVCSAYDPTTGRVYFGGTFVTANGVTVNNICYWNPVTATFTAMDSGVSDSVQSIAVAPNGDIWVAGVFLTVGSGATAAKGLAKWSLSGNSWSVPTATMTGTVSVTALVIDSIGNLYGGGLFSTIAGVANTAYIFKYSTAGTFTALGTGMNDMVFCLAVGIDGTSIYVGGAFTSGNSVTLNRIGYWNGTTFVAMGGGVNNSVYSIAPARNGNIYAGGAFTASITASTSMSLVGMWNGASWAPLSNGITGNFVYAMYFGSDGLLYVGGDYTAVGPFTTGWAGVWNGSNWQLLDMNSTSTAPVAKTFIVTPNGDLYVGSDANNLTVIVGNNTTGITSTNSVRVFPNFTIIGPTSATMTLQAIQNLSTAQLMQFNLVVNLGERILISLQPGNKRVVSDWRGVLAGQPLPTSDFANFALQPTRADGATTNSIVTFVTGTTTGALFLMHWIPAHWAIDGAAV